MNCFINRTVPTVPRLIASPVVNTASLLWLLTVLRVVWAYVVPVSSLDRIYDLCIPLIVTLKVVEGVKSLRLKLYIVLKALYRKAFPNYTVTNSLRR